MSPMWVLTFILLAFPVALDGAINPELLEDESDGRQWNSRRAAYSDHVSESDDDLDESESYSYDYHESESESDFDDHQESDEEKEPPGVLVRFQKQKKLPRYDRPISNRKQSRRDPYRYQDSRRLSDYYAQDPYQSSSYRRRPAPRYRERWR